MNSSADFAAASTSSTRERAAEASWSPLIPDDQWEIFLCGADAIHQSGCQFLLGGAMALATYTGHWRNTKDLDVIIHAPQRDRVVAAVQRCGFQDYFEKEPYDRSWIFRGYKNGVIFDVIWELPNHRIAIEDIWFSRAQPLLLKGVEFLAVSAEDLIRMKLYVMQRNRCDWVDILNVLASSVSDIDWEFLVERMGRDLPLLHSVLALFNWMSPGRAREIPEWLRKQFALPDIESGDPGAMEERRTRLLDSRPWFALHQPSDRPLEL
jgi:hypothetical protein